MITEELVVLFQEQWEVWRSCGPQCYFKSLFTKFSQYKKMYIPNEWDTLRSFIVFFFSISTDDSIIFIIWIVDFSL